MATVLVLLTLEYCWKFVVKVQFFHNNMVTIVVCCNKGNPEFVLSSPKQHVNCCTVLERRGSRIGFIRVIWL